MVQTEWPATYNHYFALGMQLPPVPKSPFFSTWGVVRTIIKKAQVYKLLQYVPLHMTLLESGFCSQETTGENITLL